MPDNDKIQRGEEIRNMLKAFSEKHLADELYGYCIRLLEKLVRKRTVSIAKGKPEIWAASIVHVIARLNFLFDKANPCFLTADTICGFFGCSKSTVSSKSTDIEKVCRIRMGDAQLCRPEISDSLTIVQLPNGMVATKEMLRHWEDSGPLDIVVELADSETYKRNPGRYG